jgi:hypothetical protein
MCAVNTVCHLFLSAGILMFISLQVLDMVLEDLKKEHPDAISVVWLSNLLLEMCLTIHYVKHK